MLIISESHRVASSSLQEFLPVITLEGPSASDFSGVDDFVSSLAGKWAKFEGHSIVSIGERENFDGIQFQTRGEKEASGENNKISRQEYWRRSYLRSRYLRQLSENEFLQHTANTMKAMKPHFTIGGEKLPFKKIAELKQRWTHCLTEAEIRRIDMRKLSKFL